MAQEADIKKKIFSTFSNIACSIGYSPLHGKIIGIILVEDRPLSLQELAKKTGYSLSMISLSLDLLEVLGVVKKIKKTADRKLYVELTGDLLEILKNAIIIKVQKSISNSLSELEDSRKHFNQLSEKEKESLMKTINILEKQIKRLDSYINLLSEIRLP